MPVPKVPALFVVAGLVQGAAPAAPVPPPHIAELQLRAIDHRVADARVDPGGELLRAVTDDDFVFTRRDGAWLDRAQFLAEPRDAASTAMAAQRQVRLFGPVALVHGLADADPGARLRYTDVYVWRGSAWRLVSAQDTPLRDGVAAAPIVGTMPTHAAWRGHDPAGDDDAVLHALNASYVQAFREADVAWYDAHLSPDYVVVQGDGSFGDRAAALARFAEPTFARSMRSFPVDRVAVRRFGDVALIHAENAYELNDGRRGISRYTDIWHRRGGRWQCVAAHITVHRAPAP